MPPLYQHHLEVARGTLQEMPDVGSDGMKAAGVLDALAKAPGFVSHVSGATQSGYRVIEVWDSPEAHQSWYEGHVAPAFPRASSRPRPSTSISR